jgi:large subunit ribosomal protein L10
MKSFKQKKEDLAELKDKLNKSKLTVFTSIARKGEKGLNVKDLQVLKKSLRATDSEFVVEKKTLLDKALKETKTSDQVDVFGFDGSMGVIFNYGDQSGAAKSAYDFSRKNQILKFFGAILGGKFVDSKGFIEFAKLPSREVLIGRILGLMKYPLSSLASVLGQVAKNK